MIGQCVLTYIEIPGNCTILNLIPGNSIILIEFLEIQQFLIWLHSWKEKAVDIIIKNSMLWSSYLHGCVVRNPQKPRCHIFWNTPACIPRNYWFGYLKYGNNATSTDWRFEFFSINNCCDIFIVRVQLICNLLLICKDFTSTPTMTDRKQDIALYWNMKIWNKSAVNGFKLFYSQQLKSSQLLKKLAINLDSP